MNVILKMMMKKYIMKNMVMKTMNEAKSGQSLKIINTIPEHEPKPNLISSFFTIHGEKIKRKK